MSVANLTRYAVFHNEHCDWNCGLMPQHDGSLVKFEEAMEASSNSLQQLKAEILPIVKEIVSDLNHDESISFVRPYRSRAMSNLSIIEAKLSAV